MEAKHRKANKMEKRTIVQKKLHNNKTQEKITANKIVVIVPGISNATHLKSGRKVFFHLLQS